MPEWEEGCASWGEGRWNESLDAFIHGLNALYKELCKGNGMPLGGRHKRDEEEEWENIRFVIVLQNPERLKENVPELMVPLIRLPEMARLDITVLFISQAQWEDIRPPLGAAPEPFFIDVPPQSKENIVRQLTSRYLALSHTSPNTYPSELEPLYVHFISLICDICYLFTHDPNELAYIAAARWPGFVQPLLDDWEAHKREAMDLEEEEEGEIPLEPPPEDIRLRMIRLYTSSITAAMESLLPRLANAKEWSEENMPSEDIFMLPRGAALPVKASKTKKDEEEEGLGVLSRMSKFIMIASYIASTNPAKSDLRMFGRGLDEKKRKGRRKGKGGGGTGGAKYPQRLLGPTPFPLDRMIAILGAILEENDVESRVPLQGVGWDDPIPGEETDLEIGRVGVFANIMQLTSMRLLLRTSQGDRLDGPPAFKCAIGYEAALGLARELKVPLGDLLWDPV